MYFVVFMWNETFHVLFEQKRNSITDYNYPDCTGGITFEFNPFRHFIE